MAPHNHAETPESAQAQERALGHQHAAVCARLDGDRHGVRNRVLRAYARLTVKRGSRIDQ